MAITAAAIKQLQDALRAFRAAHGALAVPTGAGRALEAWTLMRLASAVAMMPAWTVTLKRGDSSPLPPGGAFLFPAGGSGIRRSSVNSPSFVRLSHADRGDYELHGSLKWKGRSTANHECDLSLLPASIAQALRTSGGGHPHGLPIAIVECKDKGSEGSLDEMREAVARMFDLALVTRPPVGSVRVFETKAGTHWGRYSSQYRTLFSRGLFGIVRSRGFQAGAHTLGDHYSVGRYPRAYRDGIAALETRFRALLSGVDAL